MSDAPKSGVLPPDALTRVRRWAVRGSAALADQGLFAASNFLLNVLLARWLGPTGYGVFSVVFAGFLLLGAVHSALLTEPMLVFGSGVYARDFRAYMRTLIRLHWTTSLVSIGVILSGSAILALADEPEIALTALALVPAAPLILLTWLVRRASYATLQPHEAALGGLAYFVVMLGTLGLLERAGSMTPVSAILAMGAASVAALAVLLTRLGLSPLGGAEGSVRVRTVIRDHWRYGRWALATCTLAWVPVNLFILALPVSGGLGASGSYRALLNVIVPMIHVSTALGILVMPVLVRFGRESVDDLTGIVLRLSVAFALGAAVYTAIVVQFGEHILGLLYGGGYSQFAPLLIPLAFVPVFAALVSVLGSSLRAVERPKLVFYAYLVPTIIAVTLGIGLTVTFGVGGASYGLLLTEGTLAVALGVTFHCWRRRARSVQGSVPAAGKGSLPGSDPRSRHVR